jgi:hypothetical protein
MNVLYSFELQRRLDIQNSNISVNVIMPPPTSSNLFRNISKNAYIFSKVLGFLGFKNLISGIIRKPYESSYTYVHLSNINNFDVKGALFQNCKPIEAHSSALDKEIAFKLYNHTEKVLKINELREKVLVNILKDILN